MKRTGLLLAALISPLPALAGGSLDISLTNEMVRVEHEATRVGSGAHLTVGGAYTEANEYFLSLGLNGVDTTSENTEWLGGVGVKGFFWNSDTTHFSAAIGGFARYTPDFMNGMGLEGSIYYAPDITSFMGAESFQEVVLRINYKILPQAKLFIGYHDLSGSVELTGKQTIDTGYHLGFRMNY